MMTTTMMMIETWPTSSFGLQAVIRFMAAARRETWLSNLDLHMHEIVLRFI